MSKPTRRIAIVLLVLVILIIGGVLVLPWIVNRPAVLEILSRGFEQRTGLSLSVKAWQVRFFPSIGLELLQPQVQDPGSTTPLLQADRLEVALQWLSLFEGRVVGKDLVIDRPRLTIRRSTDGTWSLAGSGPAAASDESSPPFALLQVVRNLLIVDGVITVIDDSSHTPRTPIHVAVTEGTLSSEMLGRHARLQISGEIPQARDRAAFSWDGSLTQNQEGNLQAAGDFRLHHLDVRHVVSSWVGGDGFSDGFSGLAQLTAHLRWSPRPDGHELIADEWRAELGEMSSTLR